MSRYWRHKHNQRTQSVRQSMSLIHDELLYLLRQKSPEELRANLAETFGRNVATSNVNARMRDIELRGKVKAEHNLRWLVPERGKQVALTLEG